MPQTHLYDYGVGEEPGTEDNDGFPEGASCVVPWILEPPF